MGQEYSWPSSDVQNFGAILVDWLTNMGMDLVKHVGIGSVVRLKFIGIGSV